MKISSASKKVLASALSAAMVVAFAPTAAFAAIESGTNVTVSFDVNGGKIVDEHIDSIPSQTVKVADNGKITLTDTYGTAAAGSKLLKKNASDFAYWFVDTDGDGKYDAGEPKVENDVLDVSGDAFSGNAIKLTAAYSEPTLTPALCATNLSGSMSVTKAELDASGLTDGTQYSAKVAFPDGSTVVNAEAAVTASSNAAKFTFSLSDAQKKAMTAGKYTFTVSDAKNGVVATEVSEMVTVTLSNGAGYGTFQSNAVTSFLVNKGGEVSYADLAKPANSTQGGYNFAGYNDGATTYTGGTITIGKDTTLTAVYNNPQVTAAAFDKGIYIGTDKGAGTLTFSVGNLVAAGDTGEYSATVTGPSGFSKTFKLTTDSNKSVTSFSDVAVQFGQKWEGDQAVTSKLEAGTYTVAVSIAAKKGQSLTEAQSSQTIATKSVELAAVSYDLGAGKWTTKVDGEVAQNPAVPVLAKVGTALSAVNDKLGTAVTGNVVADDALMGVDYYTVNGKKVSAIAAADKVEASGVAVAVAYKSAYIAAPAVAFAPAATAGKYTMTVTPAEGTKAYYSIGDTAGSYSPVPDNGTITLSANDAAVWAKVTTTDGKSSSKAVKYIATKAKAVALGTWATGVANTETSASDKNRPVRYGDTLKSLSVDAKAALAGNGYGSEKDVNAAELEQYAAVIEKAAGVEKANLDAKKGLVKAADGKSYTFLSDAAYAAAAANLDKVVEAYRANNDYAEDGVTKNSKNDVAKVNGVAVSGDTAAGYISALKAAVTGAATTAVATADAEAVIAVTSQLQAAKTGAEAKAAIEAYSKLTAAQKQLVASSDIAAAQEIASKAELAEAQDEAAIAAVKGKTVKAKAKKKTTAALKVVTSKSGAKSTFKKTSGNKKITVSKGGKITVKKGLKAGKTYKAKVKATVGAASKTVTVTVKVSK